MVIDKNSPIPVYYQLKEDIKNKISKNVWKVGQCIDSERELSENYGVSRMTVRQALGELVREGILIREKGKGTFVCEPKVKQKNIMSFSEIAKKNAMSITTKVLDFKRINMPEDLQEILPFDEVYEINRLRIINDEVIAQEVVYIPCDYCGYIDEKLLEGSFYELLNEYGYTIDYSEASIQSVLMDEINKDIFNTKSELPLLKVYSKNLTSDGKLLFIEKSIYRSDKFILEVNISKREAMFR